MIKINIKEPLIGYCVYQSVTNTKDLKQLDSMKIPFSSHLLIVIGQKPQ